MLARIRVVDPLTALDGRPEVINLGLQLGDLLVLPGLVLRQVLLALRQKLQTPGWSRTLSLLTCRTSRLCSSIRSPSMPVIGVVDAVQADWR